MRPRGPRCEVCGEVTEDGRIVCHVCAGATPEIRRSWFKECRPM
jgi:hypothetical protein